MFSYSRCCLSHLFFFASSCLTALCDVLHLLACLTKCSFCFAKFVCVEVLWSWSVLVLVVFDVPHLSTKCAFKHTQIQSPPPFSPHLSFYCFLSPASHHLVCLFPRISRRGPNIRRKEVGRACTQLPVFLSDWSFSNFPRTPFPAFPFLSLSHLVLSYTSFCRILMNFRLR